MKGGRRTAKGRVINIDDLIASAPHTTAVGNMKVNAQGDELGPGGEVTATREQRTRAYYKNHPQASNKRVSLKGQMKEQMEPTSSRDFAGLKPDTASTGAENVRTSAPEDMDADIKAASSNTEGDAQEAFDRAYQEMQEQLASDPEPEEFNDTEMPPEDIMEESDVPDPDGYEEVQLPNGDIEMRPYWNDDQSDEAEDNSNKLA